MSYRVAFLEEAKQDMDDIEIYLAEFDISVSQNFFAELKEKVLSLEDMPYKYTRYEDDPYFRRMIVKDYLLFYSVDEKRNLVIIHRIFHSLRDINQQMSISKR